MDRIRAFFMISWCFMLQLLQHSHFFKDLKPDNVVIDSDLCAKLADFGSGRFGASTGAFSFGHPAGTVGYCAPEVLSGQSHDKEADLYSFGVVTWLLFTGGMYNTGPPIAQRQQFEEHLNDWFLLQTCLEKNWPPFRGMEGDPKVPAQQAALAARFTWLLVQRWPGQRMKHEDIRKSPLLAPLQLPRFEDGPEQACGVCSSQTRKDEHTQREWTWINNKDSGLRDLILTIFTI